MPSKSQVLDLVVAGYDYTEIGRRLGIPPGRAYLIGTGLPADGGGTATARQRRRPGVLSAGAQLLVNARQHGPKADPAVRDWIRRRAHADAQMRQAASPPPDPAPAGRANGAAGKKTAAAKTTKAPRTAKAPKKATARTKVPKKATDESTT